MIQRNTGIVFKNEIIPIAFLIDVVQMNQVAVIPVSFFVLSPALLKSSYPPVTGRISRTFCSEMDSWPT